MGSTLTEETELLKDSKYRVFASNIDKALKSFEYSSEWPDLISALGKLNKVLGGNSGKYSVIPRRHKIAKRLAQCLHPHLPSGVHLKALEIYDIIFRCMGPRRLSHELFIYSAGLFPVLGFAAMNVRPYLLSMYENHFVPLGERLGPALCGFLSGVLPGLEEGSDHYDRTFSLLEKVCEGVGPRLFYGKLWECISTNSAVRLAAITYVLSHFDKRLSMEDQLHIMGTNVDVMVNGLCACVQDSSVLVQRSALDLLLVGFPMHNSQLVRSDMLRLVGAALVTVLRRDMSLNRRLFTWMLGSEVDQSKQRTNSEPGVNNGPQYFEVYSRDLLVQAIKIILNQSTGQTPHDLKPYRLLISLLDKPEIGPVILDDILFEVFRLLYLCSQSPGPSAPNGPELIKTANLMFSSLEPQYFWQYTGTMFSEACKRENEPESEREAQVKQVGAGALSLTEVCILTEFILDTVTVESYSETPSDHLPSLFLHLVRSLRGHCADLTASQTGLALSLCTKILSRVQPTIVTGDATEGAEAAVGDTNGAKNVSSVSKEESRSRLDTGNESMRSGEMLSLMSDSAGSVFTSETSMDSVISTEPDSLCTSTMSTATLKNSSSVGNLDDFNDTGDNTTDSSTREHNTAGLHPTTTTTTSSQNHVSSSSPSPPSPPLPSSASPPHPDHPHPALCMETCLAQYEKFYVRFVEVVRSRIGETKPVSQLLDSLRIKSYHTTSEERAKVLEDLLRKVLFQADDLEISAYRTNSSGSITMDDISGHPLDRRNLAARRNIGTEWTQAMQLASKLLVELSTFLSSSTGLLNTGVIAETDMAVISCDEVLPPWLQMLIVCACWLGNSAPSLQLAAISTLLDLVTLCRSQAVAPVQPSTGFTSLILIPLLKPHHVTFLETQTNAFQVIAHWLWDHLAIPTFQVRCVELLHQLQSALYSSDVAENCIGEALLERNASETRRLISFRRFAILWHVGREVTARMGTLHIGDIFYKSMLKMLDNLQLPENCPLKVEAQVWLLHSIMRGDIHRLLDPLLMMLLDPATARLSVLHARISAHQDVTRDSARENEEEEASTKIYAISSVDGNVMYHVSEKYNSRLKELNTPTSSSASSSSKSTSNLNKNKKIIAVTSLSSGDNQCVTEKKRVNQNIVFHEGIDTYTTSQSHLSLLHNISVFVNPFSTDQTTSMMNNDFDDYFVEEKKDSSSNIGETSSELIGKAVRISTTESSVGSGVAGNKSGKEDGKSGNSMKSPFKLSKPNVNILRNSSLNSLDSVKNSLIVNPSSVMISSVEFAKNLSGISGGMFYSPFIADTLFSKISEGKRESNKENNSSISNEILPYSQSGDGETSTEPGDLVRSWSFSGKESTHTTSNDLEVSTPADEYFKPLLGLEESDSQSVIENEKGEKMSTQAVIEGGRSDLKGGMGGRTDSQAVIERVLDEMCEYVDKHGGGEGEEEERETKDKEGSPPPCLKESIDSTSIETGETQSLSNQSEESPLPSNKMDSPLPSNKNLDSPLPSNNSLDSPLPSNKMDSPLPSPLPSNKNLDSPLPSNKNVSLRASSSAGNYVESTHAHVLLYCGVYDSARTQYALQTIRNMILPNSRAFLCAAATTAVTPRSPILKLLARHRKCLFGRGFHGDIESSGMTYSRSSMYLEVLISVCLYDIRSYYLNLGQARLTLEEIAGNRQVQIASVELLSVILSELAGIVRDSGKGLSCYLADLLARLKLQKIILHCILASVTSASKKPGPGTNSTASSASQHSGGSASHLHNQNSNAETSAQGNTSSFMEEILNFNSVEDEDVKNNNAGSGAQVSSQCLTLQIQLLKLLLSALILEHEVNAKRGELEPALPSLSDLLGGGGEPKYYPGRIIPQQPIFLCALARALESNAGLRMR
uniref:Protein dopey-1 homolog n=1 Tax=Cacopsylla melanoneura TaxID=428564 RepID=A0A8D9B3L0_9HEMI